MAKTRYPLGPGSCSNARGAGGGAGGHVKRAGRGKHAVGVCEDGAGVGAGLMRVLEGRAEAVAGTLNNAQNVANSSCAGF
jgi:hypothetical protein